MLRTALILIAVTSFAGCDAWLKQNVNRVDLLNESTKKLLDAIKPVKDEATAKQQLPEIKAAADEIRAMWAKIHESQEKSESNISKVTQHADMKQNQQLLYSLNRKLEYLQSADEKAYEIVKKAVEGVHGNNDTSGAIF